MEQSHEQLLAWWFILASQKDNDYSINIITLPYLTIVQTPKPTSLSQFEHASASTMNSPRRGFRSAMWGPRYSNGKKDTINQWNWGLDGGRRTAICKYAIREKPLA